MSPSDRTPDPDERPGEDATSPPEDVQDATSPPSNPEADQESVEKSREKLDEAGGEQ